MNKEQKKAILIDLEAKIRSLEEEKQMLTQKLKEEEEAHIQKLEQEAYEQHRKKIQFIIDKKKALQLEYDRIQKELQHEREHTMDYGIGF
jgi:threonine aldolase